MNSKNTWTWLVIAAGLFAYIFFFERHLRNEQPGPKPVLPGFTAAAVTSVQVHPAGQLEIRADRTNGAWWISRPASFPGQAARIEALLKTLERLVPATYVTAGELQQRPRAEEEFGFDNPQSSVVLQRPEQQTRLRFGRPTAPGDQMFLQVVGREGVYVVHAELLRLLPRSANDWRDTALVDLRSLAFEHLAITNASGVIELQRDPNNAWRLVRPLRARADSAGIAAWMQQLQTLRVSRFISDDPRADLESFGLNPPAMSLAFRAGTNTLALLQFGRNPTNDPTQVFARREGLGSVTTVPAETLAPGYAQFSEFRDRRLLSFPPEAAEIEVRGGEGFVLQHGASNSWRVASESFPVDAGLVNEFLMTLARLEVIQFVKDAITDPDLRAYGLTSPVREIVFKGAAAPGGTNPPLARLAFGSTEGDKVYVRRADEDSVYAVRLADFQRLPSAGWQLRERRLWQFIEHDVARVTVQQSGKTRELLRHGTNSWALAPGSQGIINEFAVEEAAHRFGELAATLWTARGATNRADYGFSTNGLSLTFELKGGAKHFVEIGSLAPSQYPYATVTLDGQPWVFEFPLALHHFVLSYLADLVPQAGKP